MLRLALIFVAGLALGVYAADFGREIAQDRRKSGHEMLERFLKVGKIGNSTDYWLEQGGFTTSYVALFFGYYDDRAECLANVELLEIKHPRAGYRCVPAN